MVKKTNLIRAVTLGLALVLLHAFLFTQADALFPENPQLYQVRIGIYAIFLLLVFGFDVRTKTESRLFSTSFFSKQGIASFLIFTGISLGALIVFGLFITGEGLKAVITGIGAIGIGTILLHAFIVAYDEELIFRGFIVDNLTNRGVKESTVKWTQAILFAIFHFAVAGGFTVLLIPYIVLGLIFYKISRKYSPSSQSANAGAHFGWNAFILGIVQRFT